MNESHEGARSTS